MRSQRERQEPGVRGQEDGNRSGSDVVPSGGTGSQGIDPLPESLKPCGPVDPSLAPVGLVSDFRPPELYDNKLVFAALCRSSSRREGMRAWSATWLSLVIPFLKVGTRDPGVRGWRSRGLNPRPRAVTRVRSAP